eukprot:jgi/Hompol1/1381/HPOL_002305-RA
MPTDMGFHDVIRLINYIRSKTFHIPPASHPLWTDSRFLSPFYENDPLLTLDVVADDDPQEMLAAGAGKDALVSPQSDAFLQTLAHTSVLNSYDNLKLE